MTGYLPNLLLWPRHLDGDVTEASLRAYPIFGTTGTLVAGIGLCVLALLICRAKGSDLSVRRRIILTVLRIVAVCCLLPMLFELSLHVQLSRQVRPTLAVAIDTSQSMTLTDRYVTPEQKGELARAIGKPDDGATGSPSRLSRADLVKRMLLANEGSGDSRLARLNEAANLCFFGVGRTARSLSIDPLKMDTVNEIESRAPYTSLTGGIEEIVNQLRGQPTAGILLLSDGANNTGGSPLAACERWKQAGVPVHTVTVGNPNPKDVEIRQVLANELLFAGDPATVIVQLRHRGCQQRQTSVILRSGNEELTREDVRFSGDASEVNVALTFTPIRTGERTFRVEVPPQPDEIVEQNNRKIFVSRVTSDKIRVLYIENKPRWQYRFLRDAMTRDRRLKVHILLLGGERTAKPTPPFINALPAGKEGFAVYDLIIIGDVDPTVLSAIHLEAISEMVRNDGAGLLLLAGANFNPQAYVDSALADLIPVEPAESVSGPARRPRAGKEERFRPRLTPLGQSHPAIQLGDDAEANRQQWEILPEIYWYAPVHKVRPGASVLAVHPTELTEAGRSEPVPLLAVQHFGRGKSFYCGVDETWRWRLKQGDRIFYRFWGQIVQYLGVSHLAGEKQRTHLWTDRPVYSRGESALVTVRAEELTGDAMPTVVDETEDGEQQRVTLSPSPGAENVYEARLPLETAGMHKLWIEGYSLEASAVIEVEAPQLEQQEPAANVALMKEIADNTNGLSCQAGEFGQLLDQMNLSARTIDEQQDLPLWDRPLIVLLFVGVLAAEWILRRLWQLP